MEWFVYYTHCMLLLHVQLDLTLWTIQMKLFLKASDWETSDTCAMLLNKSSSYENRANVLARPSGLESNPCWCAIIFYKIQRYPSLGLRVDTLTFLMFDFVFVDIIGYDYFCVLIFSRATNILPARTSKRTWQAHQDKDWLHSYCHYHGNGCQTASQTRQHKKMWTNKQTKEKPYCIRFNSISASPLTLNYAALL